MEGRPFYGSRRQVSRRDSIDGDRLKMLGVKGLRAMIKWHRHRFSTLTRGASHRSIGHPLGGSRTRQTKGEFVTIHSRAVVSRFPQMPWIGASFAVVILGQFCLFA